MTTAVAHPNIALVKYWGKQDGPGNRPATPSLAITLAGLTTTTSVEAADRDVIRVNGEVSDESRIQGFIGEMRHAFDLPPVAVDTRNDFPTGAGLASSASGFAALVTAVDAAFDLGLSTLERSAWARRGSASAARSIHGGFATLASHDGEWTARRLLDKDAWPLEVVVAVTDERKKDVPSSAGMARSRATSPFYGAWCRTTAADYETACRAVAERDFEALATVAEHSCFKLHALMLSTRPALVYWNAATLEAVSAVRRVQEQGVPVFPTIDAGPQVKAVCAPGHSDAVVDALRGVPGVKRVIASGLGEGAHIDPGKP